MSKNDGVWFRKKRASGESRLRALGLSYVLSSHDSTWGRGAPPPTPLRSDEEAFQRLLLSRGKKPSTPEIPKFNKKLEEIPEIALPEEKPMKIALALAKQGLVGQFMGLWPSTKTIDD